MEYMRECTTQHGASVCKGQCTSDPAIRALACSLSCLLAPSIAHPLARSLLSNGGVLALTSVRANHLYSESLTNCRLSASARIVSTRDCAAKHSA
jgi:hypothetical protein